MTCLADVLYYCFNVVNKLLCGLRCNLVQEMTKPFLRTRIRVLLKRRRKAKFASLMSTAAHARVTCPWVAGKKKRRAAVQRY